jgi:hypothetical protein
MDANTVTPAAAKCCNEVVRHHKPGAEELSLMTGRDHADFPEEGEHVGDDQPGGDCCGTVATEVVLERKHVNAPLRIFIWDRGTGAPSLVLE